MGRDCTILGLMDHDNYTRVVTANCPLAVLPRREATCAHTIMQPPGVVLMLPDMRDDWRFSCSPHVEAGLRSYAGAQLSYQLPGTDVEVAFGSLCVASYAPQPPLTPVQAATMKRLAKTIVHMIVERASLHRQDSREAMTARLSAALPELKAHNVVGRVTDVLRECYPACHVSCQVQQDGVIRLRGNVSTPYADVRNWLWEATDAVYDIIRRDNHIPVHQWRAPGQTLRAIVVKMKSMEDTYLVVETDDLKTVFDDIDAGFVLQCAMAICNVIMGEQLEVALAAKEHFLQGVTHDLRTPIHAIITSTELLLEEAHSAQQMPPSPSLLNTLNIIHDQGQQLLKTVNKLIRSDHLDTLDHHDLNRSMHSLAALESDLLQDLLQSAPYESKKDRVTIVADNRLPPAAELLLTDADLLKQALLSLMLSSLTTTHKGHVLLRTSVAPDHAYLDYEILDTGAGVVLQDWARVSLPRDKVELAGSSAPADAGLGLTTAAHIASLLDGTLSLLSSTPDEGSHYRLRLHKPTITSDESPGSVRLRLDQCAMPLTFFMPIERDIETLELSYAARHLEALGLAQARRDRAALALVDGLVMDDAVLAASTHEWQIVLMFGGTSPSSVPSPADRTDIMPAQVPPARPKPTTACSPAPRRSIARSSGRRSPPRSKSTSAACTRSARRRRCPPHRSARARGRRSSRSSARARRSGSSSSTTTRSTSACWSSTRRSASSRMQRRATARRPSIATRRPCNAATGAPDQGGSRWS
jgi:signal transduction histidine kinase